MAEKKKVYVEVTVSARATPLIDRLQLSPWPVDLRYKERYFAFPSVIWLGAPGRGVDYDGAGGVSSESAVLSLRDFLVTLHGVREGGGDGAWPVRFVRMAHLRGGAEAYRLNVSEDGAEIAATSDKGWFYGAQTLIQVLGCAFHPRVMLDNQPAAEPDAYTKRWVPVLEIVDRPAHKLRALMLDMGRGNYSMPLLKRVVRLMANLKLNLLHLHLFDDQLCGLKFDGLPVGSENPAAITIDELADLVVYARRRHVTVMPEIESWGHVQSVLYHYPHLYGGPGMWGGMSFGIGEATYELLGRMYDEVLGALEDDCLVHVGLDEANWYLLPGEEGGGHSPENMVGRIHALLQKAARKHGKRVTMHLWADHGGRPIPANIARKVVVQPWKYRQSDESRIIESLEQYGGKGRTPCMMGAGWSSAHYSGAFEATRIWSREGRKYPNVIGVTNCMWENNDVGGQLLGIYGGAAFSWNPDLPTTNPAWDPIGEDLRGKLQRWTRNWQCYFREADPAAIERDRGPLVSRGRYVFGSASGLPASPTVEWERG